MEKWMEVTDPERIGRLNQKLSKKLRLGTRPAGTFRIGYPKGSFETSVRVKAIGSSKEIWIYSGNHEVNDDYITLIGSYDPGRPGPLLIDLQFNFPKGRFDRRKGGAFVEDSDGRVYLAHRGIVTRGTARVKKAALLRNLTWRHRVSADSNNGRKTAELLLVGALDDDQLIARVAKFSGAVRDAATLAAIKNSGANSSKAGSGAKSKNSVRGEKNLDMILSGYRDEFAGTRTVNRQCQIVMDWKHGRVVKELRKALEGCGVITVSKEADLILQRGNNIDLFEVKRSSNSQSIYTAIGQLVFNGSSLERSFPSCFVRKFLVLPASAQYQNRQNRCKELGFNLVTFEAIKDGYNFTGLLKNER